MISKQKGAVYIIDYADFIKVGVTQNEKLRARQLNNLLKTKADFDNSYYCEMNYTDALSIERWIVKKYCNHIYPHEIIQNEVFYPHTKTMIINDIKQLMNLFNMYIPIAKYSDKYIYWYDEQTLKIYDRGYYESMKKRFGENACGRLDAK